jgi:hypothetical protein
MKSTVRYVAEPKHVEEVSLRGTADLPFWQNRLAREDLLPIVRDGKAQVLVVGARMKYMGVRFTEVSFSIMVSALGDKVPNFFLVQAFNSFRFFALCEQKLFKTPYAHADCRLALSPAPALQVLLGNETVFQAGVRELAEASPRRSPQTNEECWEGRVFLPKAGNREQHGRYFFARMKGRTDTYPFAHGEDRFWTKPGAQPSIFQALTNSHFAAEQWVIRNDATHGKSKTHRRSST